MSETERQRAFKRSLLNVLDVARTGWGNEGIRIGLRAALEELGFEVEE